MSNVKGFIIGFLAGGTVGTITALLTTPKSGKELRGDMKRKSGEYMDEADKYFIAKKDQAGKILNEGKRKYKMILNDVKSKPGEILTDAELAYNEAKEALNSGKEKIKTEADRFKSSVEAGVETYKKEVKK